MSPKTPSTPLLNLLAKNLHISKWFQGLEIELNKVANLWQHYGYYQHLSLSYNRWHWWCHDIIIECLEAYNVKSDVDLWVKVCFFTDLCIFVPLFLFCSFCPTIFVPLFLFCWGLFALKPHLPHYLIDNFCSTDLLHLHLPIFVLLFLFRYFCSTGAFFCSTIFVPLFLFHRPFCTCTYQFWFHYFCSAIFVLLFLFCWPFCTCTYQFLFRYFCSAGAFLHLNSIYHITR